MVQCTTILLLALQTFLRQGTKLFAVENLLQGAMQFMEPIKHTMHSWFWAAQVPISTESGRHRYLNLVKHLQAQEHVLADTGQGPAQLTALQAEKQGHRPAHLTALQAEKQGQGPAHLTAVQAEK
mmetsp:Transcript_67506/g.113294  ORF Transcript_67506/g.113294 Transcript_67506/m.113294 type:complete len:125 (+) Transcript_67506:421-795(+)